MSNVKVELNDQGVKELLKSSEIVDYMNQLAGEIIGRCSGAYETDNYNGKSRANVSIKTADSATYHRNIKNNELLKALK